MKKIWIITKRELASYFDSLIAYVMIVLFLGLSGSFTWLFDGNVFMLGRADLGTFFGIAFWSLFFFIPAITMRTIAEENKSGTIELLITKAISDWQIVMGKFLACLLLVMISLACTLPYYFTVAQLGNVDDGAVIGGYMGLILLSCVYISIGMLASSLTNNQIVAFLIALTISIFFQFLFDVIGSGMTGWIGELFGYLSARTHIESLSRGVIDSRDLIYFLSITLVGLIITQIMLTKRNWI